MYICRDVCMHVCMCGRACPLVSEHFLGVVVDEMSPFVCNIPGYYYFNVFSKVSIYCVCISRCMVIFYRYPCIDKISPCKIQYFPPTLLQRSHFDMIY